MCGEVNLQIWEKFKIPIFRSSHYVVKYNAKFLNI